jgi:NADH-quinone oxidoreductase subunit M
MWLFRVRFEWLRLGALLSGILVLGMTLYLTAHFDPWESGMQFVRCLPWIESYGIGYYLGVDALNLVLLLLTSLLIPLLHLYMWNYREKGYWYNLLLLQTGVTGAILSLDLILFYLFWETMLLPIFIMIGRYGHGMNQFHAMKILLMTVLGSMAMLFSILYLGYEYYKPTAPGVSPSTVSPPSISIPAPRSGWRPVFCWLSPSRYRCSVSTPGWRPPTVPRRLRRS